MSGIVQQLPALIGVVIGALASYLAGAASERTRWQRERSSRWDEKRAQAYADYGHAVKNVYVQCRRAAALRKQGAESSAAYNEALADLGKLTDERTAIWESVLLLGHPDTIAAARIWHRSVWQVELFARGERTDTDKWEGVLEDVIKDRARFHAAVRQDLGITSGDVPPGDPWESAAGAAPGQATAI